MTSTDPLSLLADQLTKANHGATPVSPPAVAPQSPFMEVLIAQVLPSLPPILAERLRTTPRVGDLTGWLAAARIYQGLNGQPYAQAVFLQHLSESPVHAAYEGLSAAIAARREPPPMDAESLHYDRCGVALCIAAAIGLSLIIGVLLFLQLGTWIAGLPLGAGLTTSVLLFCSGWTILQSMWAPYLFERIRRRPFRVHGRPEPAAWRSSEFCALWHAWHVLLGLVTGLVSLRVQAPALVSAYGRNVGCFALTAGALILLGCIFAALRMAPRIWALSCTAPREHASLN